jgi:hypothetical protein
LNPHHSEAAVSAPLASRLQPAAAFEAINDSHAKPTPFGLA